MTDKNKRRFQAVRKLLYRLVWAGLLVLGAGGVYQSDAQTTGWAEPVNISESREFSLHPSIVADAAGSVHVVWWEAGLTAD